MKKSEPMTTEKVQEIIRTANVEGIGRSNAQTFMFIWGYGRNRIVKSQDELAAESGVSARTLRSHLYELNDAGWIDYSSRHNPPKPISLKRFKH